jgi:hypothetical protein
MQNKASYFDLLEVPRKWNSLNTRAVRCNERIRSTHRFVVQYLSVIKQANASKHDYSKSKELRNRAVQINDEMIVNFKNSTGNKDLTFASVDRTDDTNNTAYTDELEKNIDNNILKIANAYAMFCNLGHRYFYDYEDVIMGKLGKRSIHDTLDVIIPNPMISKIPERIRVTLSKKYLDNLLDSLKEIGKVHRTSRNTSTALAKLFSDDCDVVPLDSERQFMLVSDYTTWEFQVVSTTPGMKTFKLQLGIVMADSSDHEIIETVIVPVAKVVSK